MSEESSQTCLWLKITETQRNYASPISCCCDCPSFGLLSFGGQIVHINEGKGTLAHFTLQTMFYLSLSSHFYFPPPPQFYYFPSSIFSFPPPQFQNFNIFPPPPPHFYCFPSSSSSFLLFSHHHHHHISIVFPPPPPHIYCFLSTRSADRLSPNWANRAAVIAIEAKLDVKW